MRCAFTSHSLHLVSVDPPLSSFIFVNLAIFLFLISSLIKTTTMHFYFTLMGFMLLQMKTRKTKFTLMQFHALPMLLNGEIIPQSQTFALYSQPRITFVLFSYSHSQTGHLAKWFSCTHTHIKKVFPRSSYFDKILLLFQVYLPALRDDIIFPTLFFTEALFFDYFTVLIFWTIYVLFYNILAHHNNHPVWLHHFMTLCVIYPL